MIHISNEQLLQHLPFSSLIPALKKAFCSDITTPIRHHHDYKNPKESIDSTLLLMPSWEVGKYLGVKLVNVSPNNFKYQLPSIQGIYLLFDAHKGIPLAMMDAKLLTNLRTAAASALASQFLSNENASSLLMIGTGALAPYLIEAHASVRPIKKVYIWGRNPQKAEKLASKLSTEKYNLEVITDLNQYLGKAAIVSCATLSKTPLVSGKYLREGQHIDLVGSFKPDMREADDAVLQKAHIFVDNIEGATKETGDLVIPLAKGIISKEDFQADLFQLCQKEKQGRLSSNEITVFKSVGHALEDLAAAKLVYEEVVEKI